MTARQRNRITTRFSERIPVVKRHICIVVVESRETAGRGIYFPSVELEFYGHVCDNRVLDLIMGQLNPIRISKYRFSKSVHNFAECLSRTSARLTSTWEELNGFS
jgi:hypothetical protein